VPVTGQAQTLAPRIVGLNARSVADVRRDQFFQYTATFTFVTGLETFAVNITVLNDAHFMCVSTSYANSLEVSTALAGGAGGPVAILNGGGIVQITDGHGRLLSNAAVPVTCLFGTAREPFVWPFTHWFRANGFIGLQVTGAGATMAAGVLRLVFNGFKVPPSALPSS